MKRIGMITLTAMLLTLQIGVGTARADDADFIGRLFMTPAERARIDAIRVTGNAEHRVDLNAAVPARPVDQIIVNGFVQRSAGPDTVFVNGLALQDERPRADDIMLVRGPDGENHVVVAKQNQGSARLKPGQAWDLRNNQIAECSACAVVDTDSAVDPED